MYVPVCTYIFINKLCSVKVTLVYQLVSVILDVASVHNTFKKEHLIVL